jgi:AraC family transcriptional regulator
VASNAAISVRRAALSRLTVAPMNARENKQREQASAERFGRVLAFIGKHLNEALPLRQLSRVAHFSAFHFHRQFSIYVGLSPNRYIQLARLRRASYRLAFNPLEAITRIALDSGFEHAESFSRAFKSTFGQSPSAFRTAPNWVAWSGPFQQIPIRETPDMQVKIISMPTVKVAALEHRADPALLNDSVQRFIAWRKHSGLSPIASSQIYGIAYGDPETVGAADFGFDIGGSVLASVPATISASSTGQSRAVAAPWCAMKARQITLPAASIFFIASGYPRAAKSCVVFRFTSTT